MNRMSPHLPASSVSPEAFLPDGRMVGVVDHWIEDAGTGYITPKGYTIGQWDFFVVKAELLDGYTLASGMEVCFQPTASPGPIPAPGRPMALKVKRMQPPEIIEGTVSSWNEQIGYGFIVSADGREFYAHRGRLLDGGSLRMGDKVTFEPSFNAKKGKAMAICVRGAIGRASMDSSGIDWRYNIFTGTAPPKGTEDDSTEGVKAGEDKAADLFESEFDLDSLLPPEHRQKKPEPKKKKKKEEVAPVVNSGMARGNNLVSPYGPAGREKKIAENAEVSSASAASTAEIAVPARSNNRATPYGKDKNLPAVSIAVAATTGEIPAAPGSDENASAVRGEKETRSNRRADTDDRNCAKGGRMRNIDAATFKGLRLLDSRTTKDTREEREEVDEHRSTRSSHGKTRRRDDDYHEGPEATSGSI